MDERAVTNTHAPTVSTDRLVVSLATLTAWIAITFGGAKLLLPADRSLVEVVTRGVAWQIVLACGLLVAVILWQRWRDLGFRGPEPGTLKLLWLPTLMVALQLALAMFLGLPGLGIVGLVLLNTLFVGVSEEVMFRGVLYRALRPRMSIWPAILLVSVAFGAVHILNGFITGAFTSAFQQAAMAACSGLLLMALFLRTGSLWVAILYHAMWDAATFLIALGAASDAEIPPDVAAELPDATGLAALAFPILMVLPNLLYALWLLRSAHRSRLLGDAPPEDSVAA